MCELQYWIALSTIPGIGSRVFFRLKDIFGSPRGAWTASKPALESVLTSRPDLVSAILESRASQDPGQLLARLRSTGVKTVIHSDPLYPDLLRSTATPPPVLYYVGSLPGPGDVCVSVVGTRKPTPYGHRCAYEIASALARSGFWVVSGMALGIDSYSHTAALEVGGCTVAVLGCGPDIAYPRQNRALYDRITHAGAVVSEYYPGTRPVRASFPARNRIVSGLSVATVVVQAGRKSGALITARFALEQGRDVYVVPGDIHRPASAGTNLLLYDGAAPVVDVEMLINDLYDKLEAWRIPRPKQAASANEPEDSRGSSAGEPDDRIHSALLHGCETVDDIAREAQMDVPEVLCRLSLLELEGRVVRHASGAYCLVSR